MLRIHSSLFAGCTRGELNCDGVQAFFLKRGNAGDGAAQDQRVDVAPKAGGRKAVFSRTQGASGNAVAYRFQTSAP
jgi:hypothetical protein